MLAAAYESLLFQIEDDLLGRFLRTQVRGVDVDLDGGWLYWVAGETGAGMVGRVHLDGSSPETLLSTGAEQPVSIAVDRAAGRIFWTARDGLDSKVLRADLDGQNVALLDTTTSTFAQAIALDRLNRR